MKRRAIINKLNDYSYCIDDAGEACCYVVCGSEKAAVIDTANGKENLRDIVREITDLPLTVINTHGHPDHIFGNGFFDAARIHPADIPLHNMFFEEARAEGILPCPIAPINEGETVDLGGGVSLEVIAIKGHTPGSIGLLDKTSGNFFTGDAINKGEFWLQVPEALPLKEYLKNLEALAPYRKYIKELHSGHHVAAYEPEYIDAMHKGITEILNGACDGKTPWFGGDALFHFLPDGTKILFTEEKL